MVAWLGPLVGGALGFLGANEQRKAMDRATEAQMAGFEQYRPYVDDMLSRSGTALNDQLNAGYYTGDTLAGPNSLQTDTMTSMGNLGTGMITSGSALMDANSGFGTNAGSLYSSALANSDAIKGYAGQFDRNIADQRNMAATFGQLGTDIRGAAGRFDNLGQSQSGIADRFSGMADAAGSTDRMGIANQYALDNFGSTADAILRDDRRRLNEETLTNIDYAASGTGNTNSSRAGVAEAVARRGLADREADVKASVINELRNQSLQDQDRAFGQQSSALQGAMAATAAAGSQFGSGVDTLTAAGSQFNQQANAFNNAAANARNAADIYSAANSGLGMAGNFNSQIRDAYNTGMNTAQLGGSLAMASGDRQMGFDQASLDDARARYEGNRDFEMNALAAYNAGILGRAPNSPSNVQPNYNSPLAGAIGGAMSGYQFQNEYFPNGFGFGTFGGGGGR